MGARKGEVKEMEGAEGEGGGREVEEGGEGFTFDFEGDVPQRRCSFLDT